MVSLAGVISISCHRSAAGSGSSTGVAAVGGGVIPVSGERRVLDVRHGRLDELPIAPAADLVLDRYPLVLVPVRLLCHCQAVTAKDAIKTDSQLSARCAAIASVGAATIHIVVAPMHWRDWLPSGLFFASIAMFQLLWALLAWSRPVSALLAAGVAANAGSAALWVLSRTAGAPFGPSAGQPEVVDAAGIAVLLLQCYVVMGAGWALVRRYRAQEVSGVGRALVLLGANTVMAGAVTVGLVSTMQGHQHHHGGVAEAEDAHPAVPGAHAEGQHHEGGSHSAGSPRPDSPGSVATPPPAEPGPLPNDTVHDTAEGDHAEHAAPANSVARQSSSAETVDELGLSPGELESDGHRHDHG